MARRAWLMAAWVLIGAAGPAAAGQFRTVDLPEGGGPAIVISGLLETGDAAVFHTIAARLASATVVTMGPGGRVAAAMAIGSEIRARGWATLVPAGGRCASACSLIWLAGARRLLGTEAQIGFHAMSLLQEGQLRETHAADGVLRAWLGELGYALDATATIVNTHAASIRWFDGLELQANGIENEAYP